MRVKIDSGVVFVENEESFGGRLWREARPEEIVSALMEIIHDLSDRVGALERLLGWDRS